MSRVDRNDVAKYYIQCELENILDLHNITLKEGEYHTNIPRLLEALSFTYRANRVFDFVESGKITWSKAIVDVEDITLTGMGEHLTPVVYGADVKQNPIRFAEYIKKKLSEPVVEELFEQLRPRPVPRDRQTIILRKTDGALKMLDGSHRFMSMVISGYKKIPAYIGELTDKGARPMIGDATFLRLRRQWQETDDTEFRHAIERTIIGMMRSSIDGESAVQSYWVTMAPNATVKHKGEELLKTFHDKRQKLDE